MIRGLYIAGTGLLARSHILNTVGNNIANASTAGFKKDGTVSGTFGEYLTYQMANNGVNQVGDLTGGASVDEVYTLLEQGLVQSTGLSTDLAIEGEGFFLLQRPDGRQALTRNGQFGLNEEGFLADALGNLVMGANGPVAPGRSDFTVGPNGQVFSNGVEADALQIFVPLDPQLLAKGEGTTFLYNDPAWQGGAFTGTVRQGYLENSNVDMLMEMSDMLQNSRSYQSCGQLVKMMDQIMEKTVNEIGRV